MASRRQTPVLRYADGRNFSDFRDGHLKDKSEFFDVAKHKKASFEASEIVKNEAGTKYAYTAKGKLTLKGVTKDVELRFNYDGSKEQDGQNGKVTIAGFEGETVINRVDFGVGEAGGIGNDVKIEITLEAGQDKK